MADEKRLIDADALMDEFRRYMVERYDREKCVSEENCKTCENSCLWRKKVSEAPTVDALEVVHARWAIVCEACVCSACHKASIATYYFCPECGAKMDGVSEYG